nr:unnamed protein product [Callosobruchus chinensis]
MMKLMSFTLRFMKLPTKLHRIILL